MNRRLLLLLTIALVMGLALGSWLARAESAPEVASYHLESGGLRVMGASSGGSYRLMPPEAPVGTGTPCCCMYLPCVRR
jgi:hypothetical protein